MVRAGSESIKEAYCYSATVCLDRFIRRSGLLCIFLSHLFQLSVALNLAACLPRRSLDWLTFRYVFPKSIDLVSFWDQMAWQVINLSLCIFHLQRNARYREAKRGGGGGVGEKGREGGGLNRTTGPWSPSWSFKWSKAKRSKCWIYKRSLVSGFGWTIQTEQLTLTFLQLI